MIPAWILSGTGASASTPPAVTFTTPVCAPAGIFAMINPSDQSGTSIDVAPPKEICPFVSPNPAPYTPTKEP
jgi:hypothetical protein